MPQLPPHLQGSRVPYPGVRRQWAIRFSDGTMLYTTSSYRYQGAKYFVQSAGQPFTGYRMDMVDDIAAFAPLVKPAYEEDESEEELEDESEEEEEGDND